MQIYVLPLVAFCRLVTPAPKEATRPSWGGLVSEDLRRLSWGELVASPPILTTSEIYLAQMASIRRPRPSLLLMLLFVSVSISNRYHTF